MGRKRRGKNDVPRDKLQTENMSAHNNREKNEVGS